MADVEKIKLASIWKNKTKKEGKQYLSSGWVKLSQEEFDKLVEWQSDGYAVKFQIWPNDFKKDDNRKPDANLYMIRGDVEGGQEE